MEVIVVRSDAVLTHVKLSGRMDVEGVQRAGGAFTEAVAGNGADAVVDLGRVSFMASIGMRLLLENARKLNAGGARFAICCPSGMVAESIKIAGISAVVPVVDSMEQAEELFSS